MLNQPMQFDKRLSLKLDVNYHPVEQTFSEYFKQLIDDGLSKKRV